MLGWLSVEQIRDGKPTTFGLFYGGRLGQLGKQALAMVVVGLYAFAVSYLLAKLIERFVGFRVTAEDEVSGVDLTQHAETAYPEGVYGHQHPRRPSFGERDEFHPRPNDDEDD